MKNIYENFAPNEMLQKPLFPTLQETPYQPLQEAVHFLDEENENASFEVLPSSYTLERTEPSVPAENGRIWQIPSGSGEDKMHLVLASSEDSEILKVLNSYDAAARQRARDKCPEELTPAIYFMETPEEIMAGKLKTQLVAKYQNHYGLAHPPVLLPNLETGNTTAKQELEFNAIPAKQELEFNVIPAKPKPVLEGQVISDRRTAPTDMEMVSILLSRVIMCRRENSLYMYNGHYYRCLTDNEILTEIQRNLRRELEYIGSSRQLASVKAALLAEPDIEIGEYQECTDKICMENGLLNLKTLQLELHSPDCFVTWMLRTRWNPHATCPNFDAFLFQTTGGDPVLIQHFWQALGYILVCPDNRGKKVILLQGVGNSGKSCLGSLIRSFYGSEDIAAIDIFKLSERFALAGLVDKRINISMDLTNNSLSEQSVSVLKQLSGGDFQAYEVKYGGISSRKINCKAIFGSNFKIRFSRDPAFSNRLLLLPFQYSVPKEKQDRGLVARLITEKEGIFTHALRAYQEVASNGFKFAADGRNFEFLEEISGDEGLSHQAVLERFIDRHLQAAPEGFTATREIYPVYVSFCKSENYLYLETDQKFSTHLKPMLAAKFQSVNKKCRVGGHPTNGYTGVTLVL